MITGINCWARHGGVVASVRLAFDLFTGEPRPQDGYLAVAFEPTGALVDCECYDSDVVAVSLPVFEAWDAAKLDMWLRRYVKEIAGYAAEFGVPKLKASSTIDERIR